MVEVLRKLDVPAVEQVIAAPMISVDRVLQRSAIRRPQKAEQLVEVPTEPGYSLAVLAVRALRQRPATALAERIVNNPDPQGRRGVAEVFKVYEQDRVQQRLWSRTLMFLLMEVSKVFSQALAPHADFSRRG